MRKLLVVVLVTALVGVGAAAAFAKPRSIKVGDNYFVRSSGVPTVTVKKGKKVRWNWTGSAPHNVAVVSGPTSFKSKVQTSGTFTHKFTKKGLYKLRCDIHPTEMKMNLRVK